MKAKFVYEAIGDVLKPKSDKEIEKNLEKVYNEIALYLQKNKILFKDINDANKFIQNHKEAVISLLRKSYDIENIAEKLHQYYA